MDRRLIEPPEDPVLPSTVMILCLIPLVIIAKGVTLAEWISQFFSEPRR